MPHNLTRLEIRVKADLDLGQNVRVTGDNRILGNFSPNRGLDLVTTPKEYPIWHTTRPLHVPRGVPLSYKYVVFSGGQFHAWESISAHARVIIPEGPEMTIEDELGVFTELDKETGYQVMEQRQAARHVSQGLYSTSGISAPLGAARGHGSGSGIDRLVISQELEDVNSKSASYDRLSGPGTKTDSPRSMRARNPIHPHVRFQIDAPSESDKDSSNLPAGSSASASASAQVNIPEAEARSVQMQQQQQLGREEIRLSSHSDDGPDSDLAPPNFDKPESVRRKLVTPSNRAFTPIEEHAPQEADSDELVGSSVPKVGAAALLYSTFDSDIPTPPKTDSNYGTSASSLHSTSSSRSASTSSSSHNNTNPPKGSSTGGGRRGQRKYRMFLVSYNLPVLLYLDRNAAVGKRWSAEWNLNSVSRKSEGSVAYEHAVKWVGAITPYTIRDDDIFLAWTLSDDDKAEILTVLKAFDCIPIFVDRQLFLDHYVRYGLMRIRDTFHNVMTVNLPKETLEELDRDSAALAAGKSSKKDKKSSVFKQANNSIGGADGDGWDGFVHGSERFADLLVKELVDGVTDRDLVWIHNYPLILVPRLLRERFAQVGLPSGLHPNIVFFNHIPFPTSEIFRTLSARRELLEGVLGANVVGFHTFDHARHFITSCKRFLGFQFHSQLGGRLVVDYKGRNVLIAISHVGIERHQLDNAVVSRECRARVSEISEKYRGKIVIVGMDEVCRLQGIPLKLLAFERLLQQMPRYRNKAVFIQHGLHTLQHRLAVLAKEDAMAEVGYGNAEGRDSRRGSDVNSIAERSVREVKELCERINRVYGPVAIFKEYEPNEWPTVSERAAIWAAADIFVGTAVCEGLNLMPLEYTFCHRDPAGVVIVSEFSAASRVLNGALRVNCYDVEDITSTLDQAMCMSAEERNLRRERDCHYITNRSSASWTRNIIQDVENNIRDVSAETDAAALASSKGGGKADSASIGTGHDSEYHNSAVSFEGGAEPTFCQPLPIPALRQAFFQCSKRLILLDYAGTINERELGNISVKRDFLGVSKRKLASRTVAVIKALCKDPRNVVFVVSGNAHRVMESAFAEILADPTTPLGLVAHSGVVIRWGNIAPPEEAVPNKSLLKVRSGIDWPPNSGSGSSQPSAVAALAAAAADEAARRAQKHAAALGAAPGAADDRPLTITDSYNSADDFGIGDDWDFILPGVAQAWARWSVAAGIPEILDDYAWRTGGSSWRQTEVSTSFLFRQSDPEWGEMQATKLQGDLEEAIAAVNVPITVVRKKHAVELLPRGLNKGKAVNFILAELKCRINFVPQFCLTMGDDVSDEPMFNAILDHVGNMEDDGAGEGGPVSEEFQPQGKPSPLAARNRAASGATNSDDGLRTERFAQAFTCIVGRKPTVAQYFVPDSESVIQALEGLADIAKA